MLVFCFLGPFVYHGNTTAVNFADETLPPGAGHPLGTDANGHDVLARLMTSGQISLEVGIAAAMLATVIGVLWGAIAGYIGGALDAVMMRIVDAVLSIPVLFLALVVVAMVTPTEPILILVDRADLVADHLPAGPRRGALAAGQGVRASDAGDGRRQRQGGAAAHRARTRSARSWSTSPSRWQTRSRSSWRSATSGLGIRPAAGGLGGDDQQRHHLRLRCTAERAGKQAQARAVEVLGLVGMPRPAERVKRLPASAVRRDAPAGHDRHGARLLSRGC